MYSSMLYHCSNNPSYRWRCWCRCLDDSVGDLGGVLGAFHRRGPEDASHGPAVRAGGLRGRQVPGVGADGGQDHLQGPRGLQEVGRDPLHATHRGVFVLRDGARADSLKQKKTARVGLAGEEVEPMHTTAAAG